MVACLLCCIVRNLVVLYNPFKMLVIMPVKPQGRLDLRQNIIQVLAGFNDFQPGFIVHIVRPHKWRVK